jgi:hypothetical protein
MPENNRHRELGVPLRSRRLIVLPVDSLTDRGWNCAGSDLLESSLFGETARTWSAKLLPLYFG